MTTIQRDAPGVDVTGEAAEIERQHKANELLSIPEIDGALDELIEIRTEYWNALFSALIVSDDQDRSEFETVNSDYFPKLKRISDHVAALVRKHAQ